MQARQVLEKVEHLVLVGLTERLHLPRYDRRRTPLSSSCDDGFPEKEWENEVEKHGYAS